MSTTMKRMRQTVLNIYQIQEPLKAQQNEEHGKISYKKIESAYNNMSKGLFND